MLSANTKIYEVTQTSNSSPPTYHQQDNDCFFECPITATNTIPITAILSPPYPVTQQYGYQPALNAIYPIPLFKK